MAHDKGLDNVAVHWPRTNQYYDPVAPAEFVDFGAIADAPEIAAPTGALALHIAKTGTVRATAYTELVDLLHACPGQLDPSHRREIQMRAPPVRRRRGRKQRCRGRSVATRADHIKLNGRASHRLLPTAHRSLPGSWNERRRVVSLTVPAAGDQKRTQKQN